MAKLSPIYNQQVIDSDNFLLSGGKIYWYLAGTSTPATTYTDATGVTANANPVVLNSRGEPSNGIWLDEGVAYKAVLKDAADVLIRTIDNVRGVNDIDDQTISEWVLFSGAATYLSATTFSVAGNNVSTFSTNRRLKAAITAGTWYGQVASASYSGGVTTVTVTNDSTTLDSGLASVYYGVISEKSAPLQAAKDYADDAITTAFSNRPALHTYDTAGSYSLSVPSWAKTARIKAWGAGAGGLLASSGEGAGGSAGGYRHRILDVSAGGSISINVGAGGAGHAADSNGPDAGDTVITYDVTTITAGGAQGGQYIAGSANPGTPGTGSPSGQTGGNPAMPLGYTLTPGGAAPFGGAAGLVTNTAGSEANGQWPGGGGGFGFSAGGNIAGDGADGGVIIEFWPI